mmetsp:Transcript_22650/g.62538  ORF Transcript_22650/g.62538 Transcript_22650/m.62538 type:complete len:225 (+) Transcript_22650:638-1312(+)
MHAPASSVLQLEPAQTPLAQSAAAAAQPCLRHCPYFLPSVGLLELQQRCLRQCVHHEPAYAAAPLEARAGHWERAPPLAGHPLQLLALLPAMATLLQLLSREFLRRLLTRLTQPRLRQVVQGARGWLRWLAGRCGWRRSGPGQRLRSCAWPAVQLQDHHGLQASLLFYQAPPAACCCCRRCCCRCCCYQNQEPSFLPLLQHSAPHARPHALPSSQQGTANTWAR